MSGHPPLAARLPAQVGVVLVVCAVVYWFGLGTGGFHSTEGHRAIPAYEMLDHATGLNDWLVPRMFEQPYLRKPPGMPWAIALSSALLGETVFAARAVSAFACTAMAVISLLFARRWFGSRAALPAGLACALMPVLWESGRAAEIEALNNLGTQLAALALVDLLVFLPARNAAGSPAAPNPGPASRGTRFAERAPMIVIAVAGLVLLFLAKGPASVPVVLAVVAGACVARRSLAPLTGSLWAAVVPAGLVIGGLLWLIARAAAAERVPPITQSPGAFMFEPGMLLGILTLPFAAFAQMLPASFALLFPWGPDARRESDKEWTVDRFTLARALAIAWMIAVLLYMAFGVRNPRYTLPASVLLPPITGVYLAGLGAWLTPKRAKIARVLTLGGPRVLAGALLVGAVIYMYTVEAKRRATSAEPAGRALAAMLAAGIENRPVTILADDVIEARPELCLALEREATRLGLDVRILWAPGFGGELPSDHADRERMALLRTDSQSREAGLPEASGSPFRVPDSRALQDSVGFHKYRAALYLIEQ